MKELSEYEQIVLFEVIPFLLARIGTTPHTDYFRDERRRLSQALNQARKRLPERNPFLPEGEPTRWDYEVRETTGERWLPCHTIHHAKNNARFSKNATGRIRPVYEIYGSPETVPPLGQSSEEA